MGQHGMDPGDCPPGGGRALGGGGHEANVLEPVLGDVVLLDVLRGDVATGQFDLVRQR